MNADEARRLLVAATPGPWHEETAGTPAGETPWGEVVMRSHPAGGAGTPIHGLRVMWQGGATMGKGRANAALIAAAPSLAAAVIALTEELDEARATLDNERGEGTPPSEGWRWCMTAEEHRDPRCRYEWLRPGGDSRLNEYPDLALLLRVYPRHPGWAWVSSLGVERNAVGLITNHGHDARFGEVATARAAMKAADLAIAGGGSDAG